MVLLNYRMLLMGMKLQFGVAEAWMDFMDHLKYGLVRGLLLK
jgi:hypothetical protein